MRELGFTIDKSNKWKFARSCVRGNAAFLMDFIFYKIDRCSYSWAKILRLPYCVLEHERKSS